MSIPPTLIIEGAFLLLQKALDALRANRNVTEEELDNALDAMQASDSALTDAIARARARRLATDGGG